MTQCNFIAWRIPRFSRYICNKCDLCTRCIFIYILLPVDLSITMEWTWHQFWADFRCL